MIVLVGNPNSGKTSLFNKLTKSNEMVGNLSGITVDKKIGKYKNKKIVDLPGIYSLNPYTKEEVITVEYLKNNNLSLIVNVIDINSLNRSLYLTSRLMDLQIPMVILLTKCDSNTKVDINKLKELLDLNIIYISVNKNIGFDKLDNLFSSSNISNKRFDTYNNIYEDIRLRYKKIDKICEVVKYKKSDNRLKRIIDKIIFNKYISLFINVLIFILVYYVSINIIGSTLVKKTSNILNKFVNNIINIMNSINASIIFKSLIINGILKGVSSIISFIPQIIIITFIISLLEDCGYITRISIMLDKVLRKIGLSGKSFHPILLGSSCSVLGILATRTIKDKKERLKTIFLIPFIPCGAKITVIIFITSVFFNNSFIIFLSFYLISLIVLITSSFMFKNNNSTYIMEMPNLKIPSINNALRNTYYKVKNYFIRIISVIMFTSIVSWILLSFDYSFNYNIDFNNSILYMLGTKLSFLTKLFLGSNKIKETVAIISGLIAKEQVVSTLSILGNNLNKITAYTFCVFNIITVPCINTISVIKKECGFKLMMNYLLLYIIISYVISVLIYLI